ncbi:MAG: FprA family A-type flavoprotein [Candidatus Nezhaarchaeales archaeon]
MVIKCITNGVFYVGVDDLGLDIFESLWPLPHGVSYNSYLIIGREKTALIDTVDARCSQEFLDKVTEALRDRELDYIVLNHMEQDHSGSLPRVLEAYPDATVVGTPMTTNMVKSFYGVTCRSMAVKDGDTINLGGKTLKFIHAPWLHWPETMVTYLLEDRILFTCDAFGSFGALRGKLFDEEIDMSLYLDEAKRYFSNIVAPVADYVLKAIEKIENYGLEINVLAPSHGPLYRRPHEIIKSYADWSKPVLKPKVVIAYSSMYGNVKKMAQEIAKGVDSKGVLPILIDLARTHISYVLKEVIDAPSIAVGSPTYDNTVHPHVKMFIEYLTIKRIKQRNMGVFVAYAWGSNIHKRIVEMLMAQGNDIVEPVIATRASPTEETLKQCRELGEKLAEKSAKF